MSNTDLQQYNGTQSFPPTGDVGTGTDQFLVPADGPVITAQSNLTDEGPVYPAFTRIKDLLLGLRAAIVGDFAGAIRKTLHSVYADGTGGVNSTAGPGEVIATNDIVSTLGSVVADTGDVEASVGNLVAGATTSKLKVSLAPNERIELLASGLYFLSTGSGANPLPTASLKNRLCALNIPKAGGTILMSAAATFGAFDGFGVQAVQFVALSADVGGGTGVKVTFADAMDNLLYQVVAKNISYKVGGTTLVGVIVEEDYIQRTTSSCVLFWYGTNPATTPAHMQFAVFGRQTT